MLSPLRGAAALSRRSFTCGAGYLLRAPRLSSYPSSTCCIVPTPFGCRSFSSLTPTHLHKPAQGSKWQSIKLYSTDTTHPPKPDESKVPNLKTVLRKFYLLTHPDKFTEFPEAKAINEASLRDFMAYMDDYKKNPRGFPGGRMRKIPLTFYVRNERKEDAAEESAQEEPAQELRKVTGELVVNPSNPHAAKRRITQLFASCGLSGDFTFEHDIWMPPETENLQDFLASAISHARDSLQKASVHKTFVNTVLTQLQHKYKVNIDMKNDEETYYAPLENREAAEKLVKLFNLLERDGWIAEGRMVGAELGLDMESENSAQDTSGKIYLSRRESAEDWDQYLRGIKWEDVHARIAKTVKTKTDEARAKMVSEQARQTKQEELTKLLGVRTVEIKLYNSFECQFSGDSKQANRPLKDDFSEEEVEDFEKEAHAVLDRLNGSSKNLQKNSKFTKKLKNITLTFCPNMPADMKYYINRVGELFISTRINAKDLMDILTDKIALIQELQRTEQRYSEIRDYIEVRLGLKVLSMDYNYYYSQEDAVAKCNMAVEKLNKLLGKLSALQLSQMTLAISDHYGLNVDGSLFIKWDFTDEEVVLLLEGVKPEQSKTIDAQQQKVEQQQQQRPQQQMA